VVRYDDGGAIEYIGEASNGRPNGGGMMIFHSAIGDNYSMEGTFVDGQANGLMKVARAGQPDRLRVYEAGRDKSQAPVGTVFVSPFEPLTPEAEPESVPVAMLAPIGRG